jgi:hypothetical protein
MNVRREIVSILGGILFCTGLLLASGGRSQKALWIELRDQGYRRTTIAFTEEIARALVETEEMNVNFHKEGKKDLITREMLRDVLDGTEESVTVRDPEDGSEAELFMKDLEYPAKAGSADHLVLETYKAGRKDLRIVLPELEISAAGENDGEFAQITLGWKGFLPFLTKEGGALYIYDHHDNTEVYVFVE